MAEGTEIQKSPSPPPSKPTEKSPILSNEDEKETELIFSCRMCRQPLFREVHVVEGLGATSTETTEANAYFLQEPLKWMEDTSKQTEGKLHCPKCNARLGQMSWVGSSMPSGKWICPSIQIHRKAVDPRKRDKPTDS